MHEARYWERKSFLTLTYATAHLPKHRSLYKKDFQDFMKRLRQKLRRKHHIEKTKYFMVGEYGENRQRPHYHALLYGYEFPDRELCENNPDAENPLYNSKELEELWKWGICKVGDVSFDSCNYVARYTMKKQYGKDGNLEYRETQRIPPYNACSKGFGARYFREFSGDCFPTDYLIHEDSKARVPIPRYYDKLYQKLDPEAFEYVKARRIDNARHAAITQAADRTPERMSVREQILKLKAQRALGRRYEETDRQHTGPQGTGIPVPASLQADRRSHSLF